MMKFMKKYISILLALLTLGLAGQGCTERLDVPDDGTAAGETCLNFSVAVPGQGIATRADISEQIFSLWVLVFDENDFFVEAKPATASNVFGTDEDTEYKFTVTLQASPTKRTLHLVANYDFSGKNYPEYNHEYYLMSHLTVKKSDNVPQTYWQKLVLTDGIPSTEEVKNMTDAEKKALQDQISKIPLVRNFAKVQLKSSYADFTPTGFVLLNVPDRGSVAPCVMSASDFAVYQISDTAGDSYTNNPWVSRSYDELSAHYNLSGSSPGYEGFQPSDVGLNYQKASDFTDADFTTGDKYMYERPYSGDNTNTAIIVKGKYTGTGGSGKDTYYKIDFVKAVNPATGFNVYYNILRNFLYDVTIKGCTSDGYDSIDEAIKAPSMNNFLFSVDTQDYSNISDGTSRIFVEYTEKTVVSSAEPFEFKLKYIPDITAPSTSKNSDVKVRDKESKMEFHYDGTEYDESESAVVKSISLSGTDAASSTDSDGYVHFKVTPQDLPSSGELTQSVVFYVLEDGSTTDLKVARTVILHLRQPFEMKINMDSADKGVPLATGTEFLLNLYIPTGLNKSVFPLEFKIESATNNLTPNSAKNTSTDKSGYMSTWTGTSISPSTATATYGKQTFGFTKSITYDEYNALASYSGNTYKIVPCAFKTTKGTNSGKNTIYVSNPYFTPNPTSYSVEQ